MEQVVRKFRTSLGGFNRRDVMSYIEEMYAAHSKQVDALEAELAETRKEGAQQWISGILGQYDQLRQAVDELDRRLQAVGSLAAGMSGGDEGANRLRQWGGVE